MHRRQESEKPGTTYFPAAVSMVFATIVVAVITLWKMLGDTGEDLWLIISFCLIFALILALYLQSALAGRARAEALAQRRTADLALSEEKYRGLFEQSRDGIIICGMDGHILDVNPSTLAMTGYALEEVMSRPYSDFIPERWKPLNDEVIRKEILTNGYTDFHDRECIRRDGTVFPVRGRAWVMTSPEDGRAMCVTIWFRDIIEVRRAEEALKESASRLNEAQSLAHIGSWEFTLKTQAMQWSDEMYRIFELDPGASNPSYNAFMKLVHPGDRDRVSQSLLLSVDTINSSETEYRLLMGDGHVKYIHQVCRMHRDQAGNSARLVGTIQDITGQRLLEEAARLNQARIDSLIRIAQTRFSTEQMMLDYALGEAIDLTESRIGYIYFYDDEKKEFTLNTWSKGVMAECTVRDRENLVKYDLDKTGIWGEAVRQARPIVINDFPAPDPLKKGYPEGHVQLQRFMTIPILSSDRIVAVIGVANKATDYDETDVNQLTLLMGSVWQICERRRAEEALRESEERFRVQFKGIPVPTYTWKFREGDFILVDYNDAALEFTRGKIAGYVGTPASVFYEGKSWIIEDMFQCLREKAYLKNEFWDTLRTTGEKKFMAMKYAYLPPDLVMMHMEDITIQKETQEHLLYMSIHDPMTGLYNRFYADTEIKRLKSSRKYPLSIIAVDIDGLKAVNDSLGHAAGDMLINNTAYVLRQTFRPEDMVARIGGDEFLIILPSVDSAVLNQTLKRMKVHLENFNANGPEMPVSFSVGAAIASSSEDVESCIKQADMLMYRDKAVKKALLQTG